MTVHIATWTAKTGVGGTVHGMPDDLRDDFWAGYESAALAPHPSTTEQQSPAFQLGASVADNMLRFERGQVARRTLRRLLDEAVQQFNLERGEESVDLSVPY